MLAIALVVVTAPIWLALFALALLAHVVRQVALYAILWFWWIGIERTRVLFVYSDSPTWKEYVERTIVPKLPANAVVLNWSQKSQWSRCDLSVWLFRAFAGRREFNPIGLVFRRFHLVTRYRFWQPFRDLKHGRPENLRTLEERFLGDVAG